MMLRLSRVPRSLAAVLLATALLGAGPHAGADETCNSPYMGNLIKGQED
jgi:selenium-binding protein 1